jgi:hypothetical protein
MRTKKADTFDVWGKPPQTLTRGMNRAQIRALKAYTDKVTNRCYRLAFDNGLVEGLTKIATVATNELKREQQRMLRSA